MASATPDKVFSQGLQEDVCKREREREGESTKSQSQFPVQSEDAY